MRISRWLEEIGGAVAGGEGLIEVETDEVTVTVEIEAPSAGVLLEQRAQRDYRARFNEVAAAIEAQD